MSLIRFKAGIGTTGPLPTNLSFKTVAHERRLAPTLAVIASSNELVLEIALIQP
jgi:hypothetical protein